MKVLSNDGLTKLIQLTKDNFVSNDNIAQVASTQLATVATTGNYTDLSDKPTIGNATLTIQKNGTTVNTFTSNATSNVTANITVPTTTNELTNNSGFITKSVNNLDNYTLTSSLATVATSGSYTDLSNKPTLNDFTTTTQRNAINSGITSALVTQIGTNQSDISTINGKIPNAATSSNQLADKEFVNSSINNIAAYYITSNSTGSAFTTHAALIAGPYYYDGSIRTPTKNDYAIVTADEDHDNACTRYLYTGSQWAFQYTVNESPMTQAQLNAINSGITSTKVGNYDSHLNNSTIHVTSSDKTTWSGKQDALVSGTNIKTVNNNSLLGSGNINIDSLPAQSGQSGKYLTTNGSAASWNSLATVATSGSYNDLSNKLTAGTDISISNSNVISCTHPEVYLTQAEYDALVNAGTVDANTYYNTTNPDVGPVNFGQLISIRSTMSTGDPLTQGYVVLVAA